MLIGFIHVVVRLDKNTVPVTFEHPQRPPERVPDHGVVWVLPIQDEKDNNDALWYIIGEAIEYSPSIDPYSDEKFSLQNYSYPDMPPFIYGNSWFFYKYEIWEFLSRVRW